MRSGCANAVSARRSSHPPADGDAIEPLAATRSVVIQ
jgi:hypothetical protein